MLHERGDRDDRHALFAGKENIGLIRDAEIVFARPDSLQHGCWVRRRVEINARVQLARSSRVPWRETDRHGSRSGYQSSATLILTRSAAVAGAEPNASGATGHRHIEQTKRSARNLDAALSSLPRKIQTAPAIRNGTWGGVLSCAGITPIRFDGRRQILLAEVAALSARLPELPLRRSSIVVGSLPRLGIVVKNRSDIR